MEGHHLQTRRESKVTDKVCRECHKILHGLFSNTQLRDPRLELDTLEGLLANEDLLRAVTFIREKIKPGEFMRMRESKSRKRR